MASSTDHVPARRTRGWYGKLLGGVVGVAVVVVVIAPWDCQGSAENEQALEQTMKS